MGGNSWPRENTVWHKNWPYQQTTTPTTGVRPPLEFNMINVVCATGGWPGGHPNHVHKPQSPLFATPMCGKSVDWCGQPRACPPVGAALLVVLPPVRAHPGAGRWGASAATTDKASWGAPMSAVPAAKSDVRGRRGCCPIPKVKHSTPTVRRSIDGCAGVGSAGGGTRCGPGALDAADPLSVPERFAIDEGVVRPDGGRPPRRRAERAHGRKHDAQQSKYNS